jgi:hypothetical protein
MSDADDTWLDALAGRPPTAGASDPSPDAASLRAAILALKDSMPISVAGEDPLREAALLERARAAGLLGTAVGARSPMRRPPRELGWAGWLAAAMLASLVIGVTFQVMRTPSAPVTRGASGGLVTIHAADPVQLKRELNPELRAAGVPATGYERFGRQGVDAELPTPIPAAVREILRRHDIELPSGGALQLEIAPDSAR